MADAVVTLKLTPTEHRLMVSELGHQADSLTAAQKGMPAGKEKRNLQQREAALRFLLEKI